MRARTATGLIVLAAAVGVAFAILGAGPGDRLPTRGELARALRLCRGGECRVCRSCSACAHCKRQRGVCSVCAPKRPRLVDTAAR